MSVMEVKQMFLQQLKLYLDKHKMKEALELFRNEEMRQLIGSDYDLLWDVLPLICARLRGLNQFRFKTFQFCEQILIELTLICKPKEVLIALLAELENDSIANSNNHDDNCFKAILKPLQNVLLRLPTKRNETLKWVLNTLNVHLLKLQTPDEYPLESKERILLENDPNVKRINGLLPLYVQFIEAFVDEIEPFLVNNKVINNGTTNNVTTNKADPQIQRTIILKALIRLLNHPLLYMDLTHESQSESRLCAIRIILLISKLQSNFYILSQRSDLINSNHDKNNENIELTKESFLLAMANLSYLVLCERVAPISFMPCVYTHPYVLGAHLEYIDVLLQRSHSLVYEKGLLLALSLLSQINESQLESAFMDLLSRFQLEKSLIHIMIYSTVESHRQKSLQVFRRLVVCFNNMGRYKFLYSILCQPGQHSGVKGLVIGIYKDLVFTDAYFMGQNMHRFIKSAIKSSLPLNAESDLLETNDIIFSTLNLIRFICLKDEKRENQSKIWDMKQFICDNFLETLHKAIDLSRAHYKLELCKLNEQKDSVGNETNAQDPLVTEVCIAGNNGKLPNLPPDHNKQVLILALQNFDMIESVLVRVEEIINT